jgi:hypothetical protein
MGFVARRRAVGLGNVEFGGGWGDAIGHGGGRWGVGLRVSAPTATDAPAAQTGGRAGHPYDHERHEFHASNVGSFADIGIDDGTFVGQLEGGFDMWIPRDAENELFGHSGFLVGVHLTARTILMMEMAWVHSFTSDYLDQVSIQPGIRFPAKTLDLALYLCIPVDPPLGGNAFAVGFQLLWNP